MIQEIELGRLVPNKYNPRKRMTKKHLKSLRESLKRDGLLQTLLVRPIEGGKFEVVAGMRRYYCLKDLHDAKHKLACNVQKIDDETAMMRAYMENTEREQLNPIDDAGWFFEMLDLKEEQLFTPHKGGGEVDALPTKKHRNVISLARDLGISPNMIERRLPLLALPSELQELTMESFSDDTDVEIPMSISKAESVSRLRLVGDREEAQKQMRNVWRTWGRKDAEDIDKQVTDILESYRKKADEILNELGTLEDSLKRRRKELDSSLKICRDWLDPKSKKSLYGQLPDAMKNNITILSAKDFEEPEGFYEGLDGLVTEITRDDTLSDIESDLKVKQNNLITGRKNLEEDRCVYCDSRVKMDALDRRIKEIGKTIDDVTPAIRSKDNLRSETEGIKRTLGSTIKQFNDTAGKYRNALRTLVESKKLTKQQAEEKTREYIGGGL